MLEQLAVMGIDGAVDGFWLNFRDRPSRPESTLADRVRVLVERRIGV